MTLVTAAFGDYVAKDLLASDQIQDAAMNLNYSLMAKNLVFEVIGGIVVGLITAFIASLIDVPPAAIPISWREVQGFAG